jgi:hypothetical protein
MFADIDWIVGSAVLVSRYPIVPLPNVIVTFEYVPTGTSFMSSSVCSPLNRAKSTIGEPLISCTVLLFASVAVMLVTCTLNETTLAIGASVPTTNEDPVGVFELLIVVVMLLPQPATRKMAIAAHANEGSARPPSLEWNIWRHRFLRTSVASRSLSRVFADQGFCLSGRLPGFKLIERSSDLEETWCPGTAPGSQHFEGGLTNGCVLVCPNPACCKKVVRFRDKFFETITWGNLFDCR